MPRPDRVACALFDFDGVIVDSEPVGARRNVLVFQALGAPVTYEDMLELAGKYGRSEVPQIMARYGCDATFDDYLEKRREFEEAFGSIYLDPSLEVMPGAREALAALRAAGVRVGLVSTTRSCDILRALNRFGLVSAFDAVVCGDMVARRKPHPEPYLSGMSLLGATPDQTVVFDDSPTGIAAGVASGAYVFGFCGSTVEQDVSEACERLDTFASLTSWIGGLD